MSLGLIVLDNMSKRCSQSSLTQFMPKRPKQTVGMNEVTSSLSITCTSTTTTATNTAATVIPVNTASNTTTSTIGR